MSENTITREAAAKRLGCSMRTVERMLRDGRLHAIRHADGRLAVNRADLELVLREPKLLETRRARTGETPRAEMSVATITTRAEPDPTAPIRDPDPARPSLLERVTPLSLDPNPILLATAAPLARRARRLRLRRPAISIATALALTTLVLWLLPLGGSPRHQVSHKPAAHPREATTPTVPAGSITSHSAPIPGGREHRSLMPKSRGGLASLIVQTHVEPSTPGHMVAATTRPSSGGTAAKPSAGNANCGFGSLTYAGC